MRARLTLLGTQAGFVALLVAWAVVPAIFVRASAEAFMVPKATLAAWCLLVAAASTATWALAARRRPWPARLAVRWPLLALVAWTTLATATSLSPWLSVQGHYARSDGLLATAAGALLVLLVVGACWRRPDRLHLVAAAVVVGGLLDLAYVTIQQLGWDWVHWLDESGRPIARPYGLLGNSNFSGAHLAIVVPLVLALRRRPPGRWAAPTAWAVAAALGLGVWWTGTRGGLLALVGGVAAVGLLAPAVLPKAVRWGALVLTAGALVLMVNATLDGTSSGTAASTGPRFLQGSSLVDRQEIWRAGATMVRQRPLVGVGPDAFGLRFADVRPPRKVDEPPTNADEAHDVLLDRAATAGLPALAAYLWLLGTVGVAAWRWRRTAAGPERALLAGFGGAFVAYLLQGAVSSDVVPLSLLGWTMLGGLAALADPGVVAARADEGEDRPVLRPLRLVVLAGIWAVAGLLGVIVARPLVADVRYRDGVEANARHDGLAAASAFRAAVDWHGTEPRYRSRYADALVGIAAQEARGPDLRRDLLEEAITGYHQALDLAPGDPVVLLALARAEVLLADVPGAGAEAHLSRAEAITAGLVARIASDPELRVEHALVLELRAEEREAERPAAARRDRATAARDLRQLLRLRPHATVALAGLARLALADGDRAEARRLVAEALRYRPGDAGLLRLQEQIDRPS